MNDGGGEPVKHSHVGAGSSSSGGAWGAEGASPNAKSAGYPYSAVVAHRALYGAQRRRVGGRKVAAGEAAKSAPSRLSKVSAADEGTS